MSVSIDVMFKTLEAASYVFIPRHSTAASYVFIRSGQFYYLDISSSSSSSLRLDLIILFPLDMIFAVEMSDVK